MEELGGWDCESLQSSLSYSSVKSMAPGPNDFCFTEKKMCPQEAGTRLLLLSCQNPHSAIP